MRYILQEMNNSGYTYYEIIDTENKCKTVYRSVNYISVNEILKQYNEEEGANNE